LQIAQLFFFALPAPCVALNGETKPCNVGQSYSAETIDTLTNDNGDCPELMMEILSIMHQDVSVFY
jgi:hypothetical protein